MPTVNYRFVLHRGLAANWTANNPVLLEGELGVELDTGKMKLGDGATAWNSLSYFDAPPPDGDKGDITVSSGGSVWTIDADAVTYSKIQDVSATDRLLGRSTSGAGVIEEITCTSAGRDLLDDADATAQRTTLGLGTAATQNTGTNGANVPLMNAANTWGGIQRFNNGMRLSSATGPTITSGTGTPEGAVSAPVGSLFLRQDGGAGTSLYVKESGTGNTGWVAK